MLPLVLLMTSCRSSSKIVTEEKKQITDSVENQEVVEQVAETEVEVVEEAVEIIRGKDTMQVQKVTKRTKSAGGVKVETLKREVRDSTSSVAQIEEKKDTAIASHGSQKRGVGLRWYAFGCMTCFVLIAILIVIKRKLKVR